MHFDTITFKDVGLHRTDPSPTDPLLEAVAQSVAYSLEITPGLEVDHSSVEYHEELTDPSHHLSCEQHHLYVDLWDGRDRWGYSLWSGCSEQDNFVWRELDIPPHLDDLSARVIPLGDDIARSLARAHAENCFTKSC